jgi:hypothetical protein
VALELPDWYSDPGYIDVEALFVDLFKWLLPGFTNEQIGTVIPDGWYTPWEGEPKPLIRVWRRPGNADDQLPIDHALVNIATLSRSRQDSWKLNGFVRDVMHEIVGVKIPRRNEQRQWTQEKTVINTCQEWVGSTQLPEQFVDDKFVPTTFNVSVDRKKMIPDYKKILNALPRP